MIFKLRTLIDTLPRAEHLVADFVIRHSEMVISMPLAELASRTDVSEPSIMRLCRRLGCSGYSDFKLRLAQSLGNDSNFVHADVDQDDGVDEVAQKIFSRSIQELKRVRDNLNPESLDQAVAALVGCERIEFYGIGASGYVISDAQNKFFRLGKPCNAYSDLPTIKQAVAIANETYCTVFLSKTGTSNELIEACKTANDNGAMTIAITAPNAPLSHCSSITLLLDIHEDTSSYTPMSSRLAQLTMIDVLQVSLALKMGDIGEEKLRLSKEALSRDQ